MINILIDDNYNDAKQLIEFLRSKDFVTILESTDEEDWWDTLSEDAKHAIEDGQRDIRNGRCFTDSEVMAEYAHLQ
jgi:predicted transcriptional regulator